MLYILYPNKFSDKVKVVNLKPTKAKYGKSYGFAEGPFKNILAVTFRLNWLSVQNSSRPKNYQYPGEV
jgi:hypothetical protein